jgi:putative transposase
MPRTARSAPGGVIFHCINRGNNGAELFAGDGDYAGFETTMAEALAHEPVRLLAYCLMPDHWHLLIRPTEDGQMGRFVQRLTVTHVRRLHAQRNSTGHGHVYQGVYKSFPVQDDAHFLPVARYVEQSAMRAGLVKRAQDWQWSSLWRRRQGTPEEQKLLAEWPVQRPADWLARVNRAPTAAEEQALQVSLTRGRPFGGPVWQARITARLGLEQTFRPRGRPRKHVAAAAGTGNRSARSKGK